MRGTVVLSSTSVPRILSKLYIPITHIHISFIKKTERSQNHYQLRSCPPRTALTLWEIGGYILLYAICYHNLIQYSIGIMQYKILSPLCILNKNGRFFQSIRLQ